MGGRQTVESSYRQLKSLTSGGLTRDAIAVRGLVRFALMFGPVVAAENVRRLVSKVGKFLDQSDGMLAHQLRWLDLASPVLKGIRIAAGLRAPPTTGTQVYRQPCRVIRRFRRARIGRENRIDQTTGSLDLTVLSIQVVDCGMS